MHVQIGLSFAQYHVKREEPLYHLTHALPFISQLTTGQAKGVLHKQELVSACLAFCSDLATYR